MFFTLLVFIYTFLYFLGLEFAVFQEKGIITEIIVLFAISVVGSKVIGKKWSYAIIPALFSLSSIALLYLIDSIPEKQIFVLLSVLLYYLGFIGIHRLREYPKDQTARGLIAASSMTVAFFFYTGIYGIYLNFLVPLWALMLAFLLATTAIAYQYFSMVNSNKKVVWSYSITLGMVMAELAWVINFWPFGYLTTGVIVLMLYYVFWDLVQSYFLNLLSKKRVIANVVFFSFFIALILLTSRWLPAV